MRWYVAVATLLFLFCCWVLWSLFLAPTAQGKVGGFYGNTLAMVEVIYPNVVTLVWTNPPDQDLTEIRLFAQKVGETDSIPLPPFYGRKEESTESGPYVLLPGMPESVWVSLPCRSTIQDWRFWLFSVDTAGNVSQRSNIAAWTQEAQQ